MKYFNLNMNLEFAAAEYRKLSKILHSDNGGNDDEFKIMKDEYESFKAIKNNEAEVKKYYNPNVANDCVCKPNYLELVINNLPAINETISGISDMVGNFKKLGSLKKRKKKITDKFNKQGV